MVKIIFILSLLVSVAHASGPLQTGSKWQRVTTKDHEFSILMPADMDTEVSKSTSLKILGEKIKVQRVASAYSDEAVFVIEIYETNNPYRVFEDLLDVEKQQATDLSSFTYDGFPGRQQVLKYKEAYIKTQHFITDKCLYEDSVD